MKDYFSIIWTVVIVGLFSCVPSSKSSDTKATIDLKTVDSITIIRHQVINRPVDSYPRTYIDTESKYTDSAGKSVTIQNSVPKGLGYVDPTGKNFEGRIFWTRVINETDTPLEITIKFPTDSFPILSSPDSYLKLFLPMDTMTLDKEALYSYGATGLKSFLDNGLNKPTMLQRTINPNEACLFYIGMLFYNGGGVARAELVLNEQDLFYSINLLSPAIISCGKIAFKN